jgi:cell division protein FtsI (penicillin-binding protein 3)
MNEKAQRLRMGLVLVVLAAAWVGLGVRLSYLHLGDNSDLLAEIRSIREIEQKILVGRGRVLDRNGGIMALDLAVKHIAVDPKFTREHGHPTFTAYQLARLLQLDPAMVMTRLRKPDSEYEKLKDFVPEDLARQIQGMKMPGVICVEDSARNYPRGSLMSHVVGFSNADGVGSAGIEQRLDRLLRGVPGLRVTEVDGRRREIYARRQMEILPQQGADVVLTLDQNLQYFVERALEDGLATNGAKAGWAIVQRVQTGEILAMASRPDFDLNQYGAVDAQNRLNRAIGTVFEPGSVFKIIVYAAALNEGLLQPDEIIDCENGLWMYAGRPLRDYHPYGRLTAADALKKSSNIAAAKIALRLGEDRLHRYLELFGIGRPTGIALPGEEGGILNPRSRWSKLSMTRIPMGHEVAVTSLQMVNAMTALANGGKLMKPLVIRRVVTAKGQTLLEPEPEVLQRPVRAETAELMSRLLTRVTEDGTGKRARVEGFSVAGKTGTAEKPGVGGYDHTKNLASFVGFLPAERPEISIIVTFDEPQGPERTGGVVAAPVFRQIAEQAVRYLDIPPVPEAVAQRWSGGSSPVDM